jgi:RNA polymerase sigma-70 factor (ECF subfamily)
MQASLTADGILGLDGAFRRPGPREALSAETASSHEEADLRRAAWMAAAQAGDRRAYERVLADSLPLIRAAARRQGVPADGVDDVVQETLLTVHRVRHTYDPTRSYDAWITAIASRRAIDALRSHGRRDRRELHDDFVLDNQPDHADVALATEREQEARRLREAIATLPPGQREAVEQLALRERSLAEAAQHTGRNAGALKVNLHRALKALRNRIHGEP